MLSQQGLPFLDLGGTRDGHVDDLQESLNGGGGEEGYSFSSPPRPRALDSISSLKPGAYGMIGEQRGWGVKCGRID